jgi:hypothetical protein
MWAEDDGKDYRRRLENHKRHVRQAHAWLLEHGDTDFMPCRCGCDTVVLKSFRDRRAASVATFWCLQQVRALGWADIFTGGLGAIFWEIPLQEGESVAKRFRPEKKLKK